MTADPGRDGFDELLAWALAPVEDAGDDAVSAPPLEPGPDCPSGFLIAGATLTDEQQRHVDGCDFCGWLADRSAQADARAPEPVGSGGTRLAEGFATLAAAAGQGHFYALRDDDGNRLELEVPRESPVGRVFVKNGAPGQRVQVHLEVEGSEPWVTDALELRGDRSAEFAIGRALTPDDLGGREVRLHFWVESVP